MLDLQQNKSLITIVNSKANALANQFYLTIKANTTDIVDLILGGRAAPTELQMDYTATE